MVTLKSMLDLNFSYLKNIFPSAFAVRAPSVHQENHDSRTRSQDSRPGVETKLNLSI